MAVKKKQIIGGDFRTLESFWNATGTGFFKFPRGAQIRVRYGGNSRWNGISKQHQTLTGSHYFKLKIGRGSLAYARMQIKVSENQPVTYEVHPGNVAINSPKIPF